MLSQNLASCSYETHQLNSSLDDRLLALKLQEEEDKLYAQSLHFKEIEENNLESEQSSSDEECSETEELTNEEIFIIVKRIFNDTYDSLSNTKMISIVIKTIQNSLIIYGVKPTKLISVILKVILQDDEPFEKLKKFEVIFVKILKSDQKHNKEYNPKETEKNIKSVISHFPIKKLTEIQKFLQDKNLIPNRFLEDKNLIPLGNILLLPEEIIELICYKLLSDIKVIAILRLSECCKVLYYKMESYIKNKITPLKLNWDLCLIQKTYFRTKDGISLTIKPFKIEKSYYLNEMIATGNILPESGKSCWRMKILRGTTKFNNYFGICDQNGKISIGLQLQSGELQIFHQTFLELYEIKKFIKSEISILESNSYLQFLDTIKMFDKKLIPEIIKENSEFPSVLQDFIIEVKLNHDIGELSFNINGVPSNKSFVGLKKKIFRPCVIFEDGTISFNPPYIIQDNLQHQEDK